MKKYPKINVKKRGPNGPLLRMCAPVQDITANHEWIVMLVKYLYDNKLEGISANQAGINKQVMVLDVKGDHIRIMINPILTIIDYDEEPHEEACCSYPRTNCTRLRHAHIVMDYVTLKGEREILDTTDPVFKPDVALRLSARIQHEMEHLMGLSVRDEPETEQPSLQDFCSTPLRVELVSA